MSDESDAINQQTGMVNVYKLLPNAGDSLLIVNCGTHFEVRHQTVPATPTLYLTEDDVQRIRDGTMVFN